MKMVEVMEIDGRQVVKLPDEFRFRDANVVIRKVGEAIILEPLRLTAWPAEFFHETTLMTPPSNARSRDKCHRRQPWIESRRVKYLLDTNVCIAAMRNHPAVVQRLSALAPRDCAISTVTSYELFTGGEKCVNPPSPDH